MNMQDSDRSATLLILDVRVMYRIWKEQVMESTKGESVCDTRTDNEPIGDDSRGHLSD